LRTFALRSLARDLRRRGCLRPVRRQGVPASLRLAPEGLGRETGGAVVMEEGGGGRLWDGRFSESPAPEAAALGRSIGFDLRMTAEDIQASLAHVSALRDA